ncbi:hypothetical protein RJT34_14530 [Clitoria ternatea]|uniref:Uncharacterized protein n=1 Tax=Clitoria ternatea TaxID=43366 RepID=A0AAN9PL66_CLITE
MTKKTQQFSGAVLCFYYALAVIPFHVVSVRWAAINAIGQLSTDLGPDLQFDEVFEQPDPTEGLKKLVDPRLGDNWLIDSVMKGVAADCIAPMDGLLHVLCHLGCAGIY